MDKESINLFRTITEDYTIQDSQIVKFLKWGNNDIQQALNYYYRRTQKQNQSKEKNIFKPSKNQKTRDTGHDKLQIIQENKQSQYSFQQNTVFDKMKKASVKQKRTQEFIERVRKQYKLPINGKRHPSDKNNNENNKQKIEKVDNYDVQQQFKCADYLGSVFNNENQFIDQDEDQNGQIDEFNEQSINQELKNKLKQIQIQTVNLQEFENRQFQDLDKCNDRNYQKDQKFNRINTQIQVKDRKMQTRNQNKLKSIFSLRESQQIIKKKNEIKHSQIIKLKNNNHEKTKQYPIFQIQSPQKMEIQKNQHKISNKSFQQQHRFYIPNQVYIGQYFFQGFKTDTKPFPYGLQTDTLVDFKYFIEPQKKKKGFKSSKSTDKTINMRICFGHTQICRVQDHEARIFVPLITQNIIKIQIYLFQLPHIINTFAKVKFRAKVYLKKKAITVPVVQTFDGQSQQIVNIYKGIRQQIAGLLERLNLPIKTFPLIKNKSKFSKQTQKSSKSLKDAQQFQRKALQFKKKEEEYIIRKQSDPFFKVKQVNITDMMKTNQSSQSSKKEIQLTPTKERINNEDKSCQSEVKKKIIQINTIQQNKYAQLIDLYEDDIQAVYPKNNFKSQLYHYQAIALAWMLKREQKNQDQKINYDTQQIHPLWTEYILPAEEYETEKSLYYNQLTAQTSLIRPIMKTKCKGGILADQMGLGKTVMMTALISSHVQKNLKKNEAQNLVIVPLTLLSQWQSQIKKHSKNISVVCYYTSERHKLIQELGRYNVVITTYGTISHQFTKMTKFNKIGLYKYKWKRIILDQAHYIKGRIIQTSKAAYNLEGQCKWCLTGTPIQNGLNDLFSLIHFIRYAPWSQFQCWSKYIIKPHENGDEYVYEVLRNLLKRVFLRRTKNSKDHQGKSIVQLPIKHSKIQILQMSPKQRQFYDMVYESTKAKLDELDRLGIVTARYMQVLQILIKLRQVCCHPLLFKSVTKFIKNPQCFEAQLRKFIKKRQKVHHSNDEDSQNYYQPLIQGQQQIRVEISQQNKKISQTFLKQTVQKINKEELQNCLICLDNVEQPVISSCLHIFCKTCMIRQIQQFGTCATCRRILTKQDFLHLPRQNRFNVSFESEKFTRSTKMIALMEHLKNMKSDDKAVVFSQFLGMLDLLEHDMTKNKIRLVRMQGSTPQKQRAKIINQFSNNPDVKVFLVSLKTAGVGLNLVAANKVFLMDPWWNPGVEDQAIQRVHRIGQKKQVQIIRFIMDKSIQTRMVELNNEKKNLSQLVLSHKDNQNQSKFDKLRYLMQKY